MADSQLTSYMPYPRRQGWKLYLGFFLAFGLIYACTAQSSVAWQDSGIFQWRIFQFEPRSELGVALSHPLLIVLGKMLSYLPFGSPAWRMNLVSALAGAMTVANVALLVRRLAPRATYAAWIAGGTFGLAHTVWWLSTICESQTLHAALFTASLHAAVSLVRVPGLTVVLLLGLLNGLALTAHNLALLALPGYGVLVLALCLRRRLSWLGLAVFIVGWALGAMAMVSLVVEMAQQTGIVAAVRSALFGDRWQASVLGASGRAVAYGAGYIFYNFPNLALPLAAVGAVAAWRAGPRMLAGLLTYLLAIYFVFAIRYTVADQFMFFLPFYAMTAILAGVGLARLTDKPRRRWLTALASVVLLATPAIYAAAPAIWKTANLPLPGRKDLPFRDAGRYWLVPWKQDENSAHDFAQAALSDLPDGATIIADTTTYIPLMWTHQASPDGQVPPDGVVELRNLRILLGAAPDTVQPGLPNVFVVSKDPRYLPRWIVRDAAAFEPCRSGVLYRVVWKAPATAGQDF